MSWSGKITRRTHQSSCYKPKKRKSTEPNYSSTILASRLSGSSSVQPLEGYVYDYEEAHMMIRSIRDKVRPGKQQANLDGGGKAAGAAASSRPWAGLRDPRIVRVARTLGGKDRHSKVSTIRGLRDRRVRLSVPTAIQLYDLQDRLGVNQPSKVVDWLLDAARHEIDKLPPLQIPPGCFLQCPSGMAMDANGVSPPEEEEEEPPSGGLPMAASMECSRDKRRGPDMEEKEGLFFRRIEPGQQRVAEAHSMTIPFHGDHLHGQSHGSMPGMLGCSSSSEHTSCYHMEGSNLQVGVPHLGCYPISQGEELHGYRSAAPVPSSVFSAYAAAAAAAAAAASAGYDHRHSNNSFQMGTSSSQGFMLSYVPSSLHSAAASTNMRPLQLSISSRHHHCHDGDSNTEQLL